ncbi:MAG: ABC transporter substrate-binding protein [Candidatus Aminicenantes bacterium]|nr:ABC transporter substrate-binding protein [Candidatus Aminicenantes bacterium]
MRVISPLKRRRAFILLAAAFFLPACPRPGKTVYTIGILQLLESPTAREIRRGIVKALEDYGLRNGANIRLDVRDGLGDLSEVQRIARDFVTDRMDLIIAVTTPCLQAALIAAPKTPIVFTSVANPYLTRAGTAAANHLDNVTGVASTGPIRQTLVFVKEVLPSVRRVGTLWTPSELNSEYYLGLLRSAADELGLEIVTVPVANPNEVLLASQVLINKRVDAIYQISDNTVNASFEALGQAAVEAGLPLFGGFLLSTRSGACAAMGWDFFDMGYKTGSLAVRIKNGEKPAGIPFLSMSNVHLSLNPAAAARQGIRFTEAVRKRAAEIVAEDLPAGKTNGESADGSAIRLPGAR